MKTRTMRELQDHVQLLPVSDQLSQAIIAMLHEALLNGISMGYSDGNVEGYNKGYDDGHFDGYDEGYTEGNASGYDEAINDNAAMMEDDLK